MGATHLVTFVAYGPSYFDRLPGGRTGRVMRQPDAGLATEAGRYVPEEAQPGGVAVEDNGLERFLTATRRQNFLVPPRRHRAFPLTELA